MFENSYAEFMLNSHFRQFFIHFPLNSPIVPPHVLPFSFPAEVVNMGDIISINCVVLKGDLPLNIYWTINNEPITTGVDGFTVMQLNARTSYLNVDSLEAKHRGTYRCIAMNLAGLAEYAAELQVNGGFGRIYSL